ncbi:hypothetical protein BVC80_8177g4 [Macleaya cordata]|uniref:Gag-pol polyprotein n=1 Tax=Macleaya cordata TaxID=56857 RepID=A0A200QAG1_MACCD|nr:hypothetical protein BVC80_8177g4 [Macleaya cordata]
MLTTQFENLRIEEHKTFNEFYGKLGEIVSNIFALGETNFNSKIIRKVLRSLLKSFEVKVTAIEESKDIDAILPKELVGNLWTFESNFHSTKKFDNIAFKVSKKVSISNDKSFDDSSDEEITILTWKFMKHTKRKKEGLQEFDKNSSFS